MPKNNNKCMAQKHRIICCYSHFWVKGRVYDITKIMCVRILRSDGRHNYVGSQIPVQSKMICKSQFQVSKMPTETQFMDFATLKPYKCDTMSLIELKCRMGIYLYVCVTCAKTKALNRHLTCI